MTSRENVFGIINRTGYEKMPIEIVPSPDVAKRLIKYMLLHCYKMPKFAFWRLVPPPPVSPKRSDSFWKQFYKEDFKGAVKYDEYGVAWESGSKEAMHLKRMHNPLKDAEEIEDILNYPFPEFSHKPLLLNRIYVKYAKLRGKFTIGDMQCTVWERAWYIRGMMELMTDMLCDEEKADAVLDKVTDIACNLALSYAGAGCDALFLGDDIGMQSSIMMSLETYDRFIKPRLKRVIDTARSVNPEIKIFYHSCGYVEPFIERLIEVGVDVLNPLQPECMDIKEIMKKYGDRISFCGGIGTQSLMPKGTPEEIEAFVKDTLDFAGPGGGLLICPTHMLEPDVPTENVIAYMNACKKYRPQRG